MKFLHAAAVALVVVLAPTLFLYAQERVAPATETSLSSENTTGLLQKISYQSQVIHVLDDQLKACRSGQPVSGSTPKLTLEDFSPHAAAPVVGTATHTTFSQQPVAVAAVPVVAPATRRVAGVYQSATTDSRLTCDDYSMSYFTRHSAMAQVCGITLVHEVPVAPSATTVTPTQP